VQELRDELTTEPLADTQLRSIEPEQAAVERLH
jgi:hypothetical protein